MPIDWHWIIIGAAAAGFVQGVSGFAFSLVAMSIWVWVLDPKVATVLAIFGGMTGQWFSSLMLKRRFDWRALAPTLVGGALGIPLGLWLVSVMSPRAFMITTGITLVVFCPCLLLASHLPRIERGGRLGDAVAGFGGGVMTAFGGFAGVVPTLWATLRGHTKDTQRAVIQNFNLAVLTMSFAVIVLQGRITRDLVPQLALVAPALLLPSLLGMRVYRGMSEAQFKRMVLAILTFAGVAMLVHALA